MAPRPREARAGQVGVRLVAGEIEVDLLARRRPNPRPGTSRRAARPRRGGPRRSQGEACRAPRPAAWRGGLARPWRGRARPACWSGGPRGRRHGSRSTRSRRPARPRPARGRSSHGPRRPGRSRHGSGASASTPFATAITSPSATKAVLSATTALSFGTPLSASAEGASPASATASGAIETPGSTPSMSERSGARRPLTNTTRWASTSLNGNSARAASMSAAVGAYRDRARPRASGRGGRCISSPRRGGSAGRAPRTPRTPVAHRARGLAAGQFVADGLEGFCERALGCGADGADVSVHGFDCAHAASSAA